MRAIVYKDNNLKYQTDYPTPKPKNNEALIRVTHAGICSTDLEIMKGYMGFQGIPGHEFVGIVEKCSDKKLIGKRVVGEINIGCGVCDFCLKKMQNHCTNRSVLGISNKDGVFAEYITLPIPNLHIIPDSITDKEGVFTEPVAAAFEIIEQVNIRRDDKVCVLGDGRLGLITGQVISLTKCRLTVIGKHKEKLSIIKKKGIETRLLSNPPAPPFNKGGLEGLREFDYVIDCTGSTSGIEYAMKIVKPRGTIILKTTVAEKSPFNTNQIVIDEITLLGSRCGPFPPAIKTLKENSIDVHSLISKVFPLEDGLEALSLASQKDILKVLLKI